MFTKILVPVDGSEDGWAALAQAIKLAKEENSTIHGLFVADVRVIEAPYYLESAVDIGVGMSAVNPKAMEAALETGKQLSKYGHTILQQLTNQCQQNSIACETDYVEGIISQTIIERAQDVDLIVMGRQGEGSRWAGPMFGSVFEAVVRHAPVPVMAAQAEVRPLKHILLAYDGSDISKQAMQVAISLMKGKTDRSLVFLTVEDGHRHRDQQHKQGSIALREAGVHFHDLLLEGHTAETILTAARENNVDLIIMGAYGHTHFMEMLFGSTANEVVRGAICPLILCR